MVQSCKEQKSHGYLRYFQFLGDTHEADNKTVNETGVQKLACTEIRSAGDMITNNGAEAHHSHEALADNKSEEPAEQREPILVQLLK